MAKTRRVFEVAKELGVSSKAIVEKCQAEGVPGITNHMSVVKLGLIETIREWFHVSESHNAVESAGEVDLKQARKGVRRRAKAKVKIAESESNEEVTPPPAQDAATATMEKDEVAIDAAATTLEKEIPSPEKEAEVTQESEAEVKVAPEVVHTEETAHQAPEKTTESESEPAVETKAPLPQKVNREAVPADHQAKTGKSETQARHKPSDRSKSRPTRTPKDGPLPVAADKGDGPMGVPNVPDRPDIVKVGGELLKKPAGVQLKGPKVVRVEKPDELRQPKKRSQQGGPGGGRSRPGGPGGGGGSGQRGPQGASDQSIPDGQVPGITRSRGPARGRGAGGRAGEQESEDRKRRRASANSRRGGKRESQLLTGPNRLSDADIAELDAKLRGAGGYIKQRRQQGAKRGGGGAAPTPVQTGGKVEIEEPITIKDLSSATGIKSGDIIKHLLSEGIMATVNSTIDTEAAMEVAMEYEIELEVKAQKSAAEQLEEEFAARDQIEVKPRPPIVTVLGHVDHGKTSLLDRIRRADVAASEDGGITQHVGAYRVTITGHDGEDKTVVFLDTPGHEAFTSMRARGANMTDLIVLVVAADDGVMPQTIESISHAKSANVPVVVALNKIDAPQATEENIQKIYGQLAEHGLNPVEWGGETEIIKTSAIRGDGITDLLEILDYQAELLELTADYGGAARGAVIEAEMQEGRGPVARVLVQDGHLRIGDFIVIGRSFGRVRDMTNDRGHRVTQVGPATPIELSGIDMVPDAGDMLFMTDTLKKAEEVAKHFREVERDQELKRRNKVSLEGWADMHAASVMKELRVVLKADVQGSIETLIKTLGEIGNEEVNVKVIHSAVGGINESDVLLADASDAIIIGFHVVAPAAVKDIAEKRSIDIRLYRVIYDITDDVKAALEGLLTPDVNEEDLGTAEVREVFKISKLGNIAGCLVTDGAIQKTALAKVVRDDVIVTAEREIESLRRVKDDVNEVRSGTECGIRLVGFEDLKQGDKIVCYRKVEVKRTLD